MPGSPQGGEAVCKTVAFGMVGSIPTPGTEGDTMKIEFLIPENISHMVDGPEPAAKNTPNWYKNIPRFLGDGKPEIKDGEVSNNSVKACVPFYDALTFGYIQKTWCDIYIDINDDLSFEYQYARSPKIISHRDSSSIYTGNNFYPIEFLWQVYWTPKVPPGWSVMFSHPINRLDLPFYSLSGIVDSDSFHHIFPGNYPFYIKKGFSGIIPAGTPMYQLTPIKRESWNSESVLLNDKQIDKMRSKVKSNFFSSYKRFFHKKKSFK